MQTKKVTLGKIEYTIAALPIRAAGVWRKQLDTPLQDIVGIITALDTDLTNTDSMQAVLAAVRKTVLGSMDIILELLFSFSDVLRKDRERIEENAYEDEAVAAFVEVVKLAYPLDSLVAAIRPLMGKPKIAGRKESATLKK